MQEILICVALYLVLAIVDLPPRFRQKQWKYLRFSLPVYALTFVVCLFAAKEGLPVSITSIIIKALSVFVK